MNFQRMTDFWIRFLEQERLVSTAWSCKITNRSIAILRVYQIGKSKFLCTAMNDLFYIPHQR